MHPVILLVVLVSLLLFISWYKRAPKGQQKKILQRALIVGGLGLVLVLLVTGRLHPLFAALIALIPIAQRLLAVTQIYNTVKSFKNTMKSAGGPSPGQTSDVETRYLRMSLNHDTGEMGGVVLEGPFKGKRLSELDVQQLLVLLNECRANDAQSASVLEAYLDRVHGDAWREQEQAAGSGESARAAGSNSMTRDEACEILGVRADATREEIIEAHRRLMQKMHPDRGGSTYLASKINRAKDLLLGEA